jgi:hypothetical protein
MGVAMTLPQAPAQRVRACVPRAAQARTEFRREGVVQNKKPRARARNRHQSTLIFFLTCWLTFQKSEFDHHQLRAPQHAPLLVHISRLAAPSAAGSVQPASRAGAMQLCLGGRATRPHVRGGRAVVTSAAAARSTREKAATKRPTRRGHGGPEFEFDGSDSGAVEFLVRSTGVRPAARAAQRLLDAQAWKAAQLAEETAGAAGGEADAGGARRSSRAAAGGQPPHVVVHFQQVRDVVRLLLDAGVGKKALPRTLELFPGALALPQAALDARLDALDALGLDTPAALGRVLEKAPGLLALTPDAVAARAAQLAALGVEDVAALVAAAPGALSDAAAAFAARVDELAALTRLAPPALGQLAARHPPLLARPLGGTLTDRAAFFADEAGVSDVPALAAAVPAALTASVDASLRPKARFVRDALGLAPAEALQRCPALFGAVNLERTLKPRLAYLRALGVATAAAADALPQWVEGDADAFIAAAATLAPGADAVMLTVEAFRSHGAACAEAAAAQKAAAAAAAAAGKQD